jgi:hypothetical protein
MKMPFHLARPKTNPAALAAMGANRSKERAQDRELELLELARDSAVRIVALTELVGDLQDRIAVLEAKTP